MKTLIYLAAFILFTACSSSQQNKSMMAENLQGQFQFTEVKGDENLPKGVHIRFDSLEKRVDGNAGCNLFFGSYSQDGNTLKFAQLASTKKLCIDDKVNEVENKILSTLDKIQSFKLQNDELHLLGEGEEVLLVAKAIDSVEELPVTSSKPAREVFELTYEYQTMLFNKRIIMTNQLMTCQELSSQKEDKNFGVLPMTENAIVEELEKIDLSEINNLEAPSSMRHVDGAPYAKLSIYYKGKTYKSKDFDGGNPPKELKALLDLMLQDSPCK